MHALHSSMRFSDASFVSHSGLKIWWGDFFSCLAKEMKNNEIMYPGNMYNNSFMYWMGVIRIEFESSVRLEFDSNFVFSKAYQC